MDRLRSLLNRAVMRLLAPDQREVILSREGIRPVPSAVPQRSIELSELLGRPSVNLDTPELQRFLGGKRVLVTGAGGSIGSEICRQMMRFCPHRVVLVERTENNLFEIDRELRERWVGADIRPCIADICDGPRIASIFEAEQPHVVFHCAAHKHVPMMEHNPCEAIKNNVFGTKTVADAALQSGASAFVLISTDKAVNPSSVMGATKRVAELYIQSLNPNSEIRIPESNSNDEFPNSEKSRISDFPDVSLSLSASTVQSVIRKATDSVIRNSDLIRGSGNSGIRNSTRFVAVRFGNVLGSSGSVVPIFQKQIEAGGPVTVTHPEMQRYFMTIPEASQLVMQAGAIGKRGEVLLLDMGSPVKIVDLARELIARNGLKVDEDIQIKFTGVRPGEKLYEELSCDDEQTRPTDHEKIRAWQLPPVSAKQVSRYLEQLSKAMDGTNADAIKALSQCVPEYRTRSREDESTLQRVA